MASLRGLLQLGGEPGVGIAADFLGRIHGLVGILEQAFDIGGVVRIQGDADAGRDIGFFLAEQERLGQSCQYLFADAFGHGDAIATVENHREFVAAEARHRIAVAHAFANALALPRSARHRRRRGRAHR